MRHGRLIALSALITMALMTSVSSREARAEYRAFWIDTFNTALNSHDDVVTVVEQARLARANALFAQVRRRGDAWYVRGVEPLPEGVPIARGFDPLADLIATAHAAGLQVHAFVSSNAIWNRATAPANPDHVFNRHGVNPASGRPFEGRGNWLTRTLLADGAATSGGGYRFGSDYWIDPGHPDAAAYTVYVLVTLVRNYDIDGLHLDRIRYPEISIAGQTPSTGASVGYNETSVGRFLRHHGMAPSNPPPAPNDPSWSQWRRNQMTALVRRIYLTALASKPRLAVSAALIAFGGGPASDTAWTSAEAYWRVYQDWLAWMEEGILDLAIPMNYKSDLTGRAAFDQWLDWIKDRQFERWALIGQGAFLNPIEATLRQTRRALTPSRRGNESRGIVFFSLATSNAASAANPYTVPPLQSTPVRPFVELASALVSGRSVDGVRQYDDPAEPLPVFAETATVPEMPWKAEPRTGHLMGLVSDTTGAAVDTGTVDIARVAAAGTGARDRVTTTTDGGGFYGAVDLAPGAYRVTVTPGGMGAFASRCTIDVTAGHVARLSLRVSGSRPAVAECVRR